METIEIELSRIFVKVVQHGGFSKAADILRIQKSTVSKAVTRLEKITGTKLLVRTTRSHTLTAAGRLFYESCLGPIQALEDAQNILYGQDSIATGTIRITAPEDIGTYLVAPAVGRLCQENPQLNFDLQYTNRIIDLVKDGFDIAIRLGKLKESRLKARHIGNLGLILVASPDYLRKAAPIKKPSDLEQHTCLSISDSVLSKCWDLQKGKQKVSVQIKAQIVSNQMSTLLQASFSGAGVVLAPTFICNPEIKSGRVVRVLDGWFNEGVPISIVSPVSISSTARLKLVGDKLIAVIKNCLIVS